MGRIIMNKSLAVFLACVILLSFCCAVSAEPAAGDEFVFGRWEQDDDQSNGPEPIEWHVLAVEGGKSLVISKYGLCAHMYHYPKTDVTWAESGLRKWLNADFFDSAFDADEQKSISETPVSTPDNRRNGTTGGADTQDKLFVLSVEEAAAYFKTDKDREAETTAYGKKHAAFVRPSNGKSEWWLRDPGSENSKAAIVTAGGEIYTAGNSVNNSSTTVRPVFFIANDAVPGTSASNGASEPVVLSGFYDLSDLVTKTGEKDAPKIISLAEAEEMGLVIPTPAEGEDLYLGEGTSGQVDRFLAAFTMDPKTPEMRNLNILIYQADFESGGVRANGLTVSIKTDKPYPITDGNVDGGAFVFKNYEVKDWGAKALFTYTLTLPQPAGFTFTFDETEMTFVRQGGSAEAEGVADAPAADETVPVETAAIETVPAETAEEKPELPAEEDNSVPSAVKAGDRIVLGHYEQDDRLSNGPEPVEWRVLEVKNGRALVISEYGLDAVRFHKDPHGAMWEDSSLREWLNGEFYETVFSEAERDQIVKGDDDLFLLSMDEAKTLFASDTDRICKATLYAAGHGARTWWWLNTQEYSEVQASAVTGEGKISATGNAVHFKQLLRPAFLLDLAEYEKAEHEGPAKEDTPESSPAIDVPEEIQVGNRIAFGDYEQDNNTANGQEPIEWRILAVENGRALLISEYGLDSDRFDKGNGNITWHECSLREWLNTDFYKDAFNGIERAQIVNDENRIFLLSVAEAKTLFTSDKDRICTPTACTAAKNTSGGTWWWLRTQSVNNDNSAACVKDNGEITDSGNAAIFNEMIRPALWLDLEKYVQAKAGELTPDTEFPDKPAEEPAAAEVTAEEPAPAAEIPEAPEEEAVTEEAAAAEVPEEAIEEEAAEEPAEPAVELPEDPEIGDVFTFGRYEQDNDADDGAEPVDWQILEIDDGRALVISSLILDAMPYHEGSGTVTWEKSTIRTWLNGEFLESAFNEAERAYIRKIKISNPKNPVFDTVGGNDTWDNVFLLDISEAEEYFETDEERGAEATDHAIENGIFVDDRTGNSWWWLRSAGQKTSDAAEVGVEGWILERGTFTNNAYVGIRPAFWMSLTAEDAESSNDGMGIVSVTNDVGTLLRRGPGFGEEILRSILNGTPVELLGETRTVNGTEWVRIQTVEGQSGWTVASSITSGK